MTDINAIVKELWQKTYRNGDIDYIQVGMVQFGAGRYGSVRGGVVCGGPVLCGGTAMRRGVPQSAWQYFSPQLQRHRMESPPFQTLVSTTFHDLSSHLISFRSLPQIKADQEGAAGRSYNYRVVMHTGQAELDLRGRCSAGQKVGSRGGGRVRRC